jgi:hypothetical protein
MIMRYIKLYEEFKHDEIYDVMMSICDTIPFKESTQYPSTEMVRVYETDLPVHFDPKQYEEYLDGWTITSYALTTEEYNIVFIKGDLKEAALSWLNEVYGKLIPVVRPDGGVWDHEKICYIDGDRRPLFMLVQQKVWIEEDRIWRFLSMHFGIKYKEMQDLVRIWLSQTYNLSGYTPARTSLDGSIGAL